jgi:hypothetical protein
MMVRVGARLRHRVPYCLDLLKPPGDLYGAIHGAYSAIGSCGRVSLASRRSFEP